MAIGFQTFSAPAKRLKYAVTTTDSKNFFVFQHAALLQLPLGNFTLIQTSSSPVYKKNLMQKVVLALWHTVLKPQMTYACQNFRAKHPSLCEQRL